MPQFDFRHSLFEDDPLVFAPSHGRISAPAHLNKGYEVLFLPHIAYSDNRGDPRAPPTRQLKIGKT